MAMLAAEAQMPSVQTPTAASPPTYHGGPPTFGCQDPRAERALTDTATARPNDTDWLHFFMTEGKCSRVSPDKSWDMLSSTGDMLVMQEHGHPAAPPLFFRPDLVSATPDPNPITPPVAPPATADASAAPPDAASNAAPPDIQPNGTASPTEAFAEAQADRQAWNAWLASLQGDVRAGADDWTRQWGSPGAGSCDTPGKSKDWQTGCQTARLHAVASDLRRQSEPYYAQGWNALPGSAPPADPRVTAAAAAQEAAERKTASFRSGQADRKKWDAWFSGFLGDYRAGAEYWFGQWRSNGGGNCANMAMTQTWRDGCEMAKRKLAAYDTRIKTDPLYVAGWQSVGDPAAAPATLTQAR
jgi:hypothetical protein